MDQRVGEARELPWKSPPPNHPTKQLRISWVSSCEHKWLSLDERRGAEVGGLLLKIFCVISCKSDKSLGKIQDRGSVLGR
jgi:hypothetical protein